MLALRLLSYGWDLVLANWEWADMARTILGAGIGTAVVQGALALLRDRSKLRRDARFTAIKLAVAFEGYVAACAHMIAENAHADTPPGEEYPDWQTALPRAPVLPEDTDGWRALDSRLGVDCLAFAGTLEQSQRGIYWIARYADYDLGDILDREAAQRGLAAFALAKRLRRAHGLGASPAEEAADILEAAEVTAASELQKRRERERRANERMKPPGASLTPG